MSATTSLLAWMLAAITVLVVGVAQGWAADDDARLRELDAFWAEVSRTVREGDFEGYRATCHEDGVLVSGAKQTSQRLSKALARWKQEFVDTKAGRIKARVDFRFSRRVGDGITAHETGIFHYSQVDSDGKRRDEYIHFEGLLVKKRGTWRTLMEYQKSRATLQEWRELK